jgi:hypothetical protein
VSEPLMTSFWAWREVAARTAAARRRIFFMLE